MCIYHSHTWAFVLYAVVFVWGLWQSDVSFLYCDKIVRSANMGLCNSWDSPSSLQSPMQTFLSMLIVYGRQMDPNTMNNHVESSSCPSQFS
jgi:uncharacterized YccA/Bax inhibitor family protein